MNLFTHDMNPKDFRLTNQVWNRMGLNSRWSIGVLTELIHQKSFETKEEWMTYYYESGYERLRKIQSLPIQEQALVLSTRKPKNIREELVQLNTHYGRTPEELNQKGLILHQKMLERQLRVPLELCQQSVHYRIIGETWNGIMGREREAVRWLEAQLKQWGVFNGQWNKTSGDVDYDYAVDFELFIEQKRIAGIQVKPDSYRGYTPYLVEAKRINLAKNENYFKRYQAPVIYVYTNNHGVVTNQEEIFHAFQHLLGH